MRSSSRFAAAWSMTVCCERSSSSERSHISSLPKDPSCYAANVDNQQNPDPESDFWRARNLVEAVKGATDLLGDGGAGLGAAHQTGWTALVADLILDPPGEATRLVGSGPDARSRFAHSYIGMGLTPVIAVDLENEHGGMAHADEILTSLDDIPDAFNRAGEQIAHLIRVVEYDIP